MSEESKMPRVNAPSSRVNIALPFSQLRVVEADDKITALAGLVLELAERYAELAPGADATDLVTRAQAALNAAG